MAWASKKQYAILMSSEEGKDLAEQLGEMEQEEFNKKFSELLGKSGQSTTDNNSTDNEEEEKQKWLEKNGYESEDEVDWWERDDNADEYEDNEDDNSEINDNTLKEDLDKVGEIAKKLDNVKIGSDEFNTIINELTGALDKVNKTSAYLRKKDEEQFKR